MKKLLIAIIVFMFGFGLYAAIGNYVALGKQHAMPTPSPASSAPPITYLPESTPQTSLRLDPKIAAINAEGNVQLDIYINTKENKVRNIQLEMRYDPAALKFVSINATELLGGKPGIIKKIDEKAGRITFSADIASQYPPIQASDEIATLVFHPLVVNAAETDVSILPESYVGAEGVNTSVLTKTEGTTVKLIKGNQ
jgi:hypothetical protein